MSTPVQSQDEVEHPSLGRPGWGTSRLVPKEHILHNLSSWFRLVSALESACEILMLMWFLRPL